MSQGRSYRVAQAVVIVLGDTDCSVDEALLKMQEHARASCRTLEEVATDIVAGLVRLGPNGQLKIDLARIDRVVVSGDS